MPVCRRCQFYLEGACHAAPPVLVASGAGSVPDGVRHAGSFASVRPQVGPEDPACRLFRRSGVEPVFKESSLSSGLRT